MDVLCCCAAKLIPASYLGRSPAALPDLEVISLRLSYATCNSGESGKVSKKPRTQQSRGPLL